MNAAYVGAWFLAAAGAMMAARALLVRRVWSPRPAEPFDGVVYRVGAAAVAERACANPRVTVICMHGFVEDARYFLRTYSGEDIQLILLTSGDYHVPFSATEDRATDWLAPSPGVAVGTIEYDADVLIQALARLPRTSNVRVHGHSRGGAVVLQAAASRPDLFRDVEVILEAPVLPQTSPRAQPSRVSRWLFPFVMSWWRRHPISRFNRHLFGRLDHAPKRDLIEGFPFNPRRLTTMGRNLDSMHRWIAERGHDLYASIRRGVILIPDRDRILDPASMLASAAHTPPAIRVVPVEDCSHFVSFDRPDAIPPIDGRR